MGESVAELVRGALGGRSDAFEALVVRFQDLAVGTAYGWLRDAETAQDVAQESFVEAYLNLDRLREPAAFPGFLRRIVWKHCDRRTRRADPRRALAAEPADLSDSDSIAARPDDRLERLEDGALVRAAVEALPDHERLVVSLHYLAGLTQAACADWLELPLSTVKKRLHSARGRLRGGLDEMMERSLETLRPSRDARFSDVIRLFLAVREGEVDPVRALLDRDPSLVEAEERWGSEVTRVHALPVPNGGTPLVRAAERDHVELIELLLERGAEVDRACSCAGGETPLWAAVVAGQRNAARCLLEHGADPDRASFAGHTALHVAALRGMADLVELLCRHGALVGRRDRNGRTAADWARLKGHREIARRLDVGAARNEEIAHGPERAPRGPIHDAQRPHRPTATGIKALDLFAPLPAGARVRMRFEPGQGAVVLLGELSRRWALRAGGGGPAVVWAGWEHQMVDLAELRHGLAEFGLESHARVVWSPADETESRRARLADRAADEARGLAQGEVRDVLVVLFARPGRSAAVEAALPRFGASNGSATTLIVAERDGALDADAAPLSPPWDARIALDSSLAAISHFPAVHPLRTRSNLLDDAATARHCRLAAEARELLSWHRASVGGELDREVPSGLVDSDALRFERARALQAFLTQPFLVAEAFTGEVGRSLGVEDTLDDVEAILAGALDGVARERVLYKGRLSEVPEDDSRAELPQTSR